MTTLALAEATKVAKAANLIAQALTSRKAPVPTGAKKNGSQ